MRNGVRKRDNTDASVRSQPRSWFFWKQSTVLYIEERLEAAKNFHEEPADLQMFYQSGTVATI